MFAQSPKDSEASHSLAAHSEVSAALPITPRRVRRTPSLMQSVWARLGPQASQDYSITSPTNVEVDTKEYSRRLQLPFWLALAGPISGAFLITSTTRFVLSTKVHEDFTTKTVQSFDGAVHNLQEQNRQRLVQFTALNYGIILGQIEHQISQYARDLPDRAVDGIWSNMRVQRRFDAALTGETLEQRRQLAFAMFRELRSRETIPAHRSDNKADLIVLDFHSGAFTAVAANSFRVPSEPEDGAVFRWFERPPISAIKDGADWGALNRWVLNEETGDPLNRTGTIPAGRDVSRFGQAQEGMRRLHPDGPVRQAWSEVHSFSGSPLLLSWTSPIAYCGNYSCLEGVLAASVALESVDTWCTTTWNTIHERLLLEPFRYNITADNSAIFIVYQSDESPVAGPGTLLGLSGTKLPPYNRTWAYEAEQPIVRLVANALLQQFHDWNATQLTKESGQLFGLCEDWPGLISEQELAEGAGADECHLIATLSVPLGDSTRWLLVHVLPIRAFSQRIDEREKSVNQVINGAKLNLENIFASEHEANLALFIVVAMGSALLGLLLSRMVSRDLSSLASLMRQLSTLDFSIRSPEFAQLLSGRRARIAEVSELQEAFCRLACSIETFTKFVPEAVVQNIVCGNQRALRLHVCRREVTAMCSDIQGFTSISEGLTQADLLFLLTRYLTHMISIIETFDGVVTEILGDGILAFWNTPGDVEDHATKACAAAVLQQQAMEEINADLRAMALPQLSIRIGLHTGTVLCGNIGSETKMKFGCMGEAVDVAGFLEATCKNYGVGVLCSGATVAALRPGCPLACRQLDSLQVEGKGAPIAVYEVVALAPSPSHASATDSHHRVLSPASVADSLRGRNAPRRHVEGDTAFALEVDEEDCHRISVRELSDLMERANGQNEDPAQRPSIPRVSWMGAAARFAQTRASDRQAASVPLGP